MSNVIYTHQQLFKDMVMFNTPMEEDYASMSLEDLQCALEVYEGHGFLDDEVDIIKRLIVEALEEV